MNIKRTEENSFRLFSSIYVYYIGTDVGVLKLYRLYDLHF